MGIATDNTGLFHAAQSYCGTVYLSAISCPKMLPDPAFYAECLGESFEELVRATADEVAPKRAKGAAKPTTKRATKSPSKKARPA